MMDFLLYLVYSKGGSENLEQLRYGVIFDLIENRLSVAAIGAGPASLGTSTESRKRPESSSPEKLKARNKQSIIPPPSAAVVGGK